MQESYNSNYVSMISTTVTRSMDEHATVLQYVIMNYIATFEVNLYCTKKIEIIILLSKYLDV